MLQYRLINPPILAALAAAGHGSAVLVADGNYAHSTGTSRGVPIVHLGLVPGLVTVDQVLAALVEACPFEGGAVMAPDDGSASPVIERYAALLGDGVPLRQLPRADFTAACRGVDLCLAIATGDERYYANALLTVGARPAPRGEP